MTTLTITPDVAKKKLKLAGTVASGEKVAVTVAGFGTVSTTNLRLRVMAGDVPVGYFPLEDEDEWTVSGSDLTCTLDLATWQAERHCKFGAEVCFILEDTGTPQLYGVGGFSLRPWIKLTGVDVPKNLDNYKVQMMTVFSEIDRVEALADGKYEKPSGGIPSSDMSHAVQTSLAKADTVTMKVSKSAFDSLLGLSLPDTATQKDTRIIVQRILGVLQSAATCIALMFALPSFGIDTTTAWEDVPPQTPVKSVVEQFSPPADFSTNNADLVETIETKAPAPGDYFNVSNRAMSAVQEETDPTVPGWAKADSPPASGVTTGDVENIVSAPIAAAAAASSNYTDEAIAAIPKPVDGRSWNRPGEWSMAYVPTLETESAYLSELSTNEAYMVFSNYTARTVRGLSANVFPERVDPLSIEAPLPVVLSVPDGGTVSGGVVSVPSNGLYRVRGVNSLGEAREILVPFASGRIDERTVSVYVADKDGTARKLANDHAAFVRREAVERRAFLRQHRLV